MATQSIAIEPQMPHAAEPQVQNASLINERAQLLVDNWNSACPKLAELYEEVDAINEAFNGLKDGQEILGCKGFKVFCVRHLKRDPSTVYRMLKKARLELEPATEEETLFEKAEASACTAGDVEEEEDEDEDEGEEG
jgi:hypothetical protein